MFDSVPSSMGRRNYVSCCAEEEVSSDGKDGVHSGGGVRLSMYLEGQEGVV